MVGGSNNVIEKKKAGEETRDALVVSQKDADRLVQAVNNATGSNYTPEQISADPELQERITAPTQEQVQEEAKQLETRLTDAGATEELARAEADRYIELRLKENKTDKEYIRLINISSTPEQAQNLEGISTEQFSPAMKLSHGWGEKAETLKGDEQEHAIQMADMFRALATTQVVEPEALETVLGRMDVSEEQKTQITSMFLPSLETANELAQQEAPKQDIHARLNKDREEARKIVFLQPKLVPILREAGLFEKEVRSVQEMNNFQIRVMDRYSEKGDAKAREEQNERAREYAGDPEVFVQETYTAAEQSGYFNIAELNAMAATVAAIAAISALGEGEAEEAPGADAAAQAQMMRDIEDLAREDQERANEAKEMLDELMERAEESGEETTVGELKDDELKKRLEEMGIEQDKTIKDAIEFTNKAMETVAAQQGRVGELKQNAVEGLEPSFHTDPREALEMNGIMKDGELTEFGQSVMPDLLRASGGSFNNALDQIMDAIPIEGREEFMERVGEARLTINEYLADPGNAGKQREAAEVLTNPEFVAVRAAFDEALADNAAEVIGRLNA